MAPVLALSAMRLPQATGTVWRTTRSGAGLTDILRTLRTKRHRSIPLYETFLQPTDDVRSYPYLTYDNVLVWKRFARCPPCIPKHTATSP